MKLKTTIARLSLILLFSLILITGSSARPLVYCTPVFANGCFSWNNQVITLESIYWTLGSSTCSDYDYTNMSATLDAGTTYAMAVTNGNWCGCAVWIDLNQDEVFDANENFFHDYNGAQNYTYNFDITIPSNTPTGSYRMRVIGAWGSDGVTVGSNGYGPCGSFQYGNFDDFTVNVNGSPVGISDLTDDLSAYIEASPNPATSNVLVTMRRFKGNKATLELTDMTGKMVRTIPVTREQEELDLSTLTKGIYILRYVDGMYDKKIRLIK